MNELLVVPIGEVEERWLDVANACARQMMGVQPMVAGRMPLPEAYRDVQRNQYLATGMLETLLPVGRERNARVLGITQADLFIPILTFLFGQAQLAGRLALVSLARLRPEFYGLTADSMLTSLRLRKEVLHELGHTLGLVHCNDRRCAMSLSNSVLQVDAKKDFFCAACQELSQAHLRRVYSGGKT